MPATAAVDDSTITAEGYELLLSELDTLRTAGRREMSERLPVFGDEVRKSERSRCGRLVVESALLVAVQRERRFTAF